MKFIDNKCHRTNGDSNLLLHSETLKRISIMLTMLAILIPDRATPQWTKQNSGTMLDLYGVWFVDSLHGWICGNHGIVLYTADKGVTWSLQASNCSLKLNDIFFIDTQNGWIACNSGTILHTTNGGLIWNKQQTHVKSNLYRIQFVTRDRGYSTGERGTSLSTTDSGMTWVAGMGSDSSNYIVIGQWIDQYRGFGYTSNDTITEQYVTTDGGRRDCPIVRW